MKLMKILMRMILLRMTHFDKDYVEKFNYLINNNFKFINNIWLYEKGSLKKEFKSLIEAYEWYIKQ